MAELVDALHSGCSDLMVVKVRFFSWVLKSSVNLGLQGFFYTCLRLKSQVTISVMPTAFKKSERLSSVSFGGRHNRNIAEELLLKKQLPSGC